MNKKRQVRWNRTTVQPFLDVRTAVLNDTLEDGFRRRFSGFRLTNDRNYPQGLHALISKRAVRVVIKRAIADRQRTED